MNKELSSLPVSLNRGASLIAGIYLLIGSLWILFSDRLAERIASSKEMLTNLSLYKGWGYVIVTAFLLYWLIQLYTNRLQASENQLQVVTNALPVLISYIDKNQRYQFANEAYEEWFGQKAQGKHIKDVIGEETYQKTSKYVDKVLRGEYVSYETEIPDRDGGERLVSATYVPDIAPNGQVRGFFTLVQDISEQKEAREKLRQWADAFEGCAHGIAIGDPDTNRIVVCNLAFANMHNCSVEDIVGLSILSLYAPSDQAHVRRNVEKADQIGHTHFETYMACKGKAGYIFPVQMDIVSVTGEDGELVYRVATAQDITERKQAEEALRASEERYRNLIEQASDGIFIADSQGKYTEANSRGCDMLGYTREEMLTLSLRDVIDPEELAAHPLRLKELQEGKSLLIERKLCRKNGSTFFAEISARMLPDGSYQSIVRDISERKEVEEALRSSEMRFRALIEHSSIGFDLYDAQHRLVYYAPSNQQLLGYTLEERLQKPDQDLIHPDDRENARAWFAEVYRNPGKVFSAEFRLRHKNGGWVWVEAMGKNLLADPSVQAVVINTSNITERKQAEAALIESNTLFRTLFEASPDAILLIDPHDTWPILDCNTAACEMNGYTREELIGQPIDILNPNPFNSAKRDEYLEEIRRVGILRYETPHRRKDGTEFPIEVSTTLISPGGRDVLLGIDRDITERKRAEESLRNSQAQITSIFNSAMDAIISIDADQCILIFNPAAEAMFRCDQSEALGQPLDRFIPERFREVHRKQVHNFGQTGITKRAMRGSAVVSGRRNNGDEFPCEASISQIDIEGKKIYTVILRDISDRQRAEEELSRSEERYRYLFENNPHPMWVYDRKTLALLDVNEAAITKYGYSRQEFLSMTIVDIRPPEDVERLMNNLAQPRRPLEHSDGWRHRLKDGTIIDVEITSHTVEIDGHESALVVAQDITGRKQAEAALQIAHGQLELKVQDRTAALSQANSLLQAMMDYVPDQIYFKDLQSRFIRNSRSQANLLGLSDPAEVVGKTDFDFFPHAARAFAEEQEIMRSGNPLVDFEEWVVWPDGRETWVSTTKVPLRNSNGETIGIFGISRDITERKHAEQAIRQLNADLEQQAIQLQNANKELEAFSYSVSHDLRAPLRAIDGYTRILVEDYEALLDAEGKRVCGIISAEARRMGQLIDDLLAFSRLGRKEMYSSNVDMKGLVVSVLNDLTKEGDREHIDFKIARLPSIRADASLMRQVWVNLLANALKFTSKKERATIEVGSKSSKEEIIYFVRDTGAGFDMEYANKLFGVFQRLHSESEFEGTGVGLAIVQRIIRRHDGRVWAEGAVDQGATFYFALPRKKDHDE